MSPTNQTEHDAKVLALKERFEGEGFSVLVEPPRSALPFDLDHYTPDMIARKGDGGLIVEVKTAHAGTSIERYQSLAATVQQHPGWRFLLVTVDDLNVSTTSQQIPSWNDLEAKLVTVRSLIDSGNIEPAVLYLWSVWEAAMRKLAIAVALPIERLPATKLMNQLYTAGYISIDDFATAKSFLPARNAITHGFGTPVDGPLLERFLGAVHGLIQDWKKERVNSEMLES